MKLGLFSGNAGPRLPADGKERARILRSACVSHLQIKVMPGGGTPEGHVKLKMDAAREAGFDLTRPWQEYWGGAEGESIILAQLVRGVDGGLSEDEIASLPTED